MANELLLFLIIIKCIVNSQFKIPKCQNKQVFNEHYAIFRLRYFPNFVLTARFNVFNAYFVRLSPLSS